MDRYPVVAAALLAAAILAAPASAASSADGERPSASAGGAPTAAAGSSTAGRPGRAPRRSRVIMGIGEQNATMFEHPEYRKLGIRRVRYFIRWDAAFRRAERRRADQFVLAARRNRARVLLHVSTSNFAPRRGHLPTPRQYRIAVGRLVHRYARAGVHEWGVWNEANHVSQPTYRSPRRAAQYFMVLRRICRRCRIVALDVLDQQGAAGYVRRFYRFLSPADRWRARIIGIHNYSDVNRRGTKRTMRVIRAARGRNPRVRFWLTETGGLVAMGRAFPCSERRAANRLSFMFRIVRRLERHGVERLYPYNWTGLDCDRSTRFDAGLVRPDGSLRPGFHVVHRYGRHFRR